MRIALEGMRFRAPHGVFAEEKRDGNDFVVDVWLDTKVQAGGLADELAGTVDYMQVYEIVKTVMDSDSRNLLETLAQAMLDRIGENFAAVEAARVRVSKLNPPVGGPVARSFVELEWQRP